MNRAFPAGGWLVGFTLAVAIVWWLPAVAFVAFIVGLAWAGVHVGRWVEW